MHAKAVSRRRLRPGVLRLSTLGTIVWMATAGFVTGAMSPGDAAAIDVEFIDFFKGVDRFDGAIPPNSGYFVELCLIGTDVVSAEVVKPDMSSCPMDDIFFDEICCEEQFDSQQALDAAFPTGPGQNYTVNITGAATVDSEVVEFDVAAPTAYPAFVSPGPGEIIDTNQDLTIEWMLVDKGGCNLAAPATCGDGIAVFVSEIQGPGDDIFEDSPLPMTATMTSVGSVFLEPGTPYRIEVETARTLFEAQGTTDGNGDPYLLSLFHEDINSIFVPEPASEWAEAVALAALFGMARARRRWKSSVRLSAGVRARSPGAPGR